MWAGLGPRGGAGADSDGGGDRDSGSDPDARAGTATGSATGTECGPSVRGRTLLPPRGGAEMTKATLPTWCVELGRLSYWWAILGSNQ